MPEVVSSKAVFVMQTGELLYLAPQDVAIGAGQGAASLPSGYTPEWWAWDVPTRSFREIPAAVEEALISAIKTEAERRKMTSLTPGGAKKAEYADKRAEVAYWDTLGGSVSAILAAVNLMPPAQKKIRFAWALADAAAFGDTIDKAIARFRAGIDTSASVMQVAAVEAATVAKIKAATTIAAKRAVAWGVKWP